MQKQCNFRYISVIKKLCTLCYIFTHKNPDTLCYIFILKNNALCVTFIYKTYRIVLIPINARTIKASISKNKFELFIENWSYSYDKQMVFNAYWIMRA